MADASTTTPDAGSTAPANPDEYQIGKQKVKTLDSKDYDLGWTVQAPGRPVQPSELNPVTLQPEELPDPVEAADMGVDVESYLANFTNVVGTEVTDGGLVDAESGKPVIEDLTARHEEAVAAREAAVTPAGSDTGAPAPADSAPAGKYDGMTVEALKAEIDKRNTNRADDQKLSTTGNKPDLITTLQQDDGV